MFIYYSLSLSLSFSFMAIFSFLLCLSVVHKEGFVLFIISSIIYMLITCRLWKAIKKYSLSPEVRCDHTLCHLKTF